MNDQKLYPVLKDSGRKKNCSTAASTAWTSPATSLLTYSLLNTEDLTANDSSRHMPTSAQTSRWPSRPVLFSGPNPENRCLVSP